jgi:hypothetical protein
MWYATGRRELLGERGRYRGNDVTDGRVASDGDLEPRSVADDLVASSTFFAQSAVSSYAVESWELFHLHLATAVEQLIKAVLARANPAFIADPKADFDSLLHLSGLGERAKNPDGMQAIRTITVTDALVRIQRVAVDYQPPGRRIAVLLQVRNNIVHLGRHSKAEGESILGEVAEYVSPLLASLGVSLGDYWGASAALVADHAKRRLDALEATYQRRLQAAKERFERRIAAMDEAGRAAFIAAVAPRPPGDEFDSAVATCPACGHPGLVTGAAEPEWEPDFDVADGEGYIAGVYVKSIDISPDSFECQACGLSLDASLIPFADIDGVTLTEDDFDLSAASSYFERQLHDWPGS